MMEPIRIREKEFPNESFIWLSWHWTYSPCSAFLAPTGQTCSFEGHQSNPIPLFYSLPLYFRFLFLVFQMLRNYLCMDQSDTKIQWWLYFQFYNFSQFAFICCCIWKFRCLSDITFPLL